MIAIYRQLLAESSLYSLFLPHYLLLKKLSFEKLKKFATYFPNYQFHF